MDDFQVLRAITLACEKHGRTRVARAMQISAGHLSVWLTQQRIPKCRHWIATTFLEWWELADELWHRQFECLNREYANHPDDGEHGRIINAMACTVAQWASSMGIQHELRTWTKQAPQLFIHAPGVSTKRIDFLAYADHVVIKVDDAQGRTSLVPDPLVIGAFLAEIRKTSRQHQATVKPRDASYVDDKLHQ